MFNEAVWKEGEKKVVRLMKQNGYKVIYTNLFCVGVELDIVATLSPVGQKKAIQDELKTALLNEKDRKKRRLLKKSANEYIKNLKDILVITEVKARSGNTFGTGKEALTALKKIHLQRGAEYLLRQKEFQGMQVRFDIASVDGNKIEYIEDGFIPE